MLTNNQFKFFQYSDKLNSNIFNELVESRIAGVIIKNFLNEKEIESIMAAFSRVKDENRNPFKSNEGAVFPEPFSVLAKTGFNENDLNEIIPKGNIKLLAVLNNFFSGSYKEKLYSLFSSLGNGFNFSDALLNGTILKNEKAYFTTIREIYVNGGGIKKHCEKDLQIYYHKFFELIGLKTPHFQLSYFILLKKPQQGGELKIHNQFFKKNTQHDADKDYYLPEIDQGDIVIFNGGEIYHSVSNIMGSENRITIGGFLSKKHKNFYSWS
jgi:hapalindole-type alkaloid chlorinase